MLLYCAKVFVPCEYVSGNKTRLCIFLINPPADTVVPEPLVLYMLIPALSRLPRCLTAYFTTVYLGLSDLDTPACKFPVARNFSLLYSSTTCPHPLFYWCPCPSTSGRQPPFTQQ